MTGEGAATSARGNRQHSWRDGIVMACLGTAGGLFLAAPSAVAERAGGVRPSKMVVDLVRVLGVRDIAELALLVVEPSGAGARMIPLVEGVHAASMVGIAAVSPTHRRLALNATVLAAGLCGLQIWANRNRNRHVS